MGRFSDPALLKIHTEPASTQDSTSSIFGSSNIFMGISLDFFYFNNDSGWAKNRPGYSIFAAAGSRFPEEHDE